MTTRPPVLFVDRVGALVGLGPGVALAAALASTPMAALVTAGAGVDAAAPAAALAVTAVGTRRNRAQISGTASDALHRRARTTPTLARPSPRS